MNRAPDPRSDALDELIAESTAENPQFPALMEQARRRRDLLRDLAAERKRRGLTQKKVAKLMGISPSMISRIENNTFDVHLSTIDRYAAAVGCHVEHRVTEKPASR